jgi:type VI protein secretion system component VasF
MPPGFEERDWLKWIQSCFYNVEKAGEKLFKHIEWLQAIPLEPRLTNHTIRLL